jgi:surfeit locus 1 family protein
MSLRARVILLILVVSFAAVAIRLGFWQLGRLSERRSLNARAIASRELPEINLDSGAAGVALDNRRLRLSGEYDSEREITLRDFLYQGTPGVRLVTPLHPARGDSAILVLRGWVPAADAMTADVDSLDVKGRVEVHGVALAIPSTSDRGAPIQRHGQTTWRRLDLATLRDRIPYPIRDVYLLAERGAANQGRPFPIPIRPAPFDDGPHLSYAIQWFAFAVTGLVVGGILVVRGSSER